MNNDMPDITLSDAISRYISSRSAVLSPSTIYGYKKIHQEYFQEIMNVQLVNLDREIFQNSINRAALHYSSKTVRNAYCLAHAAIRMFMPDKSMGVTLPPKIKTSFYVPDEAEIYEIYQVIRGNELEIPFLLAAECGLRPSEICALKKDCIYDNKIEIRAAVVINEMGKEVFKPPKSFSGYRSIPISKKLEKKLMAVEGKRICCMNTNKISRDWTKFLYRNNFRAFRFYSLRHYFASQALLLGIPQKYIAEMMGHSGTAMIERVYQHTFPSAMQEFQQRIADNMDKLFIPRSIALNDCGKDSNGI